MLRTLLLLTALSVSGCRFSDESKWESSVNASTRVRTDNNKPVDAVDLSASLRRSW